MLQSKSQQSHMTWEVHSMAVDLSYMCNSLLKYLSDKKGVNHLSIIDFNTMQGSNNNFNFSSFKMYNYLYYN